MSDSRFKLRPGVINSLLAACLFIASNHGFAGSAMELAQAEFSDLTELSLENLMEINVFSVTKSEQPLRKSAAAVFVLSGDEIRHAGVKTIPDALRLIPGVTVAQTNAHSWAVTARGFNSALADKLEVLVDGRSVYTPLYSGVYWQKHNVLMADVERIEVIRGPGAALWGANAVNGVINIVTRSAKDTQQHYVEAGGSSNGYSHYGARAAFATEKTAVRVYARKEMNEEYEFQDGTEADDNWKAHRFGFRGDTELSNTLQFTLQGETYRDHISRGAMQDDQEQSSDYLSATLTGSSDGRVNYNIRAYVEREGYDIPGLFEEDRDTFNIEARKNIYAVSGHEIIVGLSYRYSKDNILTYGGLIDFTPENSTKESYGLFAQDIITIIDERLNLTLGVKGEHNDFTGTEVQPSARLAYTPSRDTTFWSAVSRAVRIPNRLDHGYVVFGAPNVPVIVGSEDFGSEELVAYEVGFRHALTPRAVIDIATFYNVYDDLRGVDYSAFPAEIANEGEGNAYGFEMVFNWTALDSLELQFGHVYQNLDYHKKDGSTDDTISKSNRNDPHRQSFFRAQWQVLPQVSTDLRVRHVAPLPDSEIEAYVATDATINWAVIDSVNLSVVGSNLLDHRHAEFLQSSAPLRQEVQIPRSIMFNLEWTF